MTKGTWLGACLAATLTSAAMAGPEWVELGDAGSLPSSSQTVSGSGTVARITGKLTGVTGTPLGVPAPDFQDMYVIYIDDPVNFIATTVDALGGSTGFDSRLYLFRLDGTGLLGNDNTLMLGVDGFSFGSTLYNDGQITEPGRYLIAITTSDFKPVSEGGDIFIFDSSIEVSPADGPGGNLPITDWQPDFGGGKLFGMVNENYTIYFEGVSAVQAFHVSMDIKVGACPNPFNRTSNGVLPVTLMGSPVFDVHDVNLATVRISRADGLGGSLAPNEGPPGPHSEFKDEGMPNPNDPCECGPNGKDNIIDLAMKFRSDALVDNLQLNDLAPGALVMLKITGELNNGVAFDAYDCVRLVPPGTPPGQLTVTSSLNDAWVNASPLDLALDGGGFAQFQRTYPQTTVVTLNAPTQVGDYALQGWRINNSTTVIPGATINYTVNASTQRIEAVYVYAPPRPRPGDGKNGLLLPTVGP